jgi:hypothetical protein
MFLQSRPAPSFCPTFFCPNLFSPLFAPLRLCAFALKKMRPPTRALRKETIASAVPCLPENETRPVRNLRPLYGLFRQGTFKKPNKTHSENLQTAISLNVCNGFTGPKCKFSNVYRGPYGFTAPRGYIHPSLLKPPPVLAHNHARNPNLLVLPFFQRRRIPAGELSHCIYSLVCRSLSYLRFKLLG